MSEYQHYAFAAVDRPLSPQEIDDLRPLAKRAAITPTSYALELHGGDFDGRPDDLLLRYFDAHTFVSSWGTRDFVLRMPKDGLVRSEVKPFLLEDRLEVRQKGEVLLLTIHLDVAEGDVDFEQAAPGLLPSLVPLRADLLAGDLRALYLGWLSAVQDGTLADATEEPPVPAGLAALTPPLEALCRLLLLDRALVAAAAQPAKGRRTAKDLRSEAGRLADELRRQAETKATAQRDKALDALAAREEEAWKEVEAVIGMPGGGPAKTAAFKDKAKVLHQLRDLADRDGRREGFDVRLAALRERFAKVPSFWMFYDPPRVSKAFGG